MGSEWRRLWRGEHAATAELVELGQLEANPLDRSRVNRVVLYAYTNEYE